MEGARHLSIALLGLALAIAPGAARATWVETHLVSDELRVQVERSGVALVDHAVTLRVQGGPLRSFDLPIADVDAVPEASGSAAAVPGEGLPIPLQVTTRPDGALRVNIESPRGIAHGLYLFHIRYRKNLLSGDGIRREGPMVRLRLRGPAWQEGLDNARCTFVLPSAPTEPRLDQERAQDPDDGSFVFVSDLKRYPDRDEVELLRSHVARGEAVMWTARVDPRALAETHDARLRPPPVPTQEADAPPQARAACALATLLLIIGFSALVLAKHRHARRAARGVAMLRPLFPLPFTVRVLLAGPALAAGAALQLWGDAPWLGSSLVLLAMGTGWYRRPIWLRAPRGPGRWLPLADRDAFRARPRPVDAWLDASTSRGLFTFALALAASAGAAALASRLAPYATYVVLFDSAVLFPIFGTGRARELPPDPVKSAAPILARVASKLRQNRALRAIGWARLPDGSDTFDELRLLCAPRLPLRGFASLEVGIVSFTGMGGVVLCPEILIRVTDGSPCHDALVKVLRGERFVRGRKPDERVVTVRPRLPSAAMTGALAARLLDCTTEKGSPYCGASTNDGNTAAKSAGRPERTANAGTVASPFQAM